MSGDSFKRVAERQVDLRPLMRVVGVYMMSRGLQRLVAQVQPGQVRSPGLRQSLMVSGGGSGGVAGKTIFNVDAQGVTVGSRMRHAAIMQHGGTILPKSGKSLAIPKDDRLARDEIWPRDLDPGRDKLTFIPAKRKGGGVIGFLVDKDGDMGFGEGSVLYMLVRRSRQRARPYLFFDAEDEQWVGDATVRYLETGRV
ncbi:MAG TPA: hypothetical protein ENI79_02150 [Rhodospirillales bacterium]|nr:hypothetical protein [Rhodospirillales bacterium]